MESLRFKAINDLTTAPNGTEVQGSSKITAIFGENVFTLRTSRKFLSDEAYKSLTSSIRGGKKNRPRSSKPDFCRHEAMGRK
jgi:glutamine synthetase